VFEEARQIQLRWCHRGVELLRAHMLVRSSSASSGKSPLPFQDCTELPVLQRNHAPGLHSDRVVFPMPPSCFAFWRHATGNSCAGAPMKLLPFPRVNKRWEKDRPGKPVVRQPSREHVHSLTMYTVVRRRRRAVPGVRTTPLSDCWIRP